MRWGYILGFIGVLKKCYIYIYSYLIPVYDIKYKIKDRVLTIKR